jgi:imidazolonepropionase-like amidohydrolase
VIAPGHPPYTLIADELLDGRGHEPVVSAAMTIEGGRIASIERRGAAWSAPDHEVIDFTGCSLAPGLIDTHCHLALQPHLPAADSIAFVEDAPDDEILTVMETNARSALAAGITTMRDCGSPRDLGVSLRALSESAPEVFPRLLVSGRPITTTAGHCHWMGRIADDRGEIMAAVRELIAEGVDFVKVMATGGMLTSSSDPYRPQYSAEDLAALVAAAHEAGRRVAAHALSAEGVRTAVAARVDTIEHCTTTTAARQDFDPAIAVDIAAAGIFVGMTAHAPLRGLLAAGDLEEIRSRLAPHRHLRASLVQLNVHSDAGTPGTAFDELARSAEIFAIGLQTTAIDAVKAVTGAAAAALGMNDVGRLSPGCSADVLVVEGRASEDIRALRDVAAVVRGGALIRSPSVDRI